MLSNLGYCSRSQCKTFLAKKDVTADGKRITSCSEKVDQTAVLIDGQHLDNPDGLLIILNKPQGYTCSHETLEGDLVYDLVPQQWLQRKPCITTVGRLDKDTSGLLLLTTVTGLVQKLTSPKHHVPKRYKVVLESPVENDQQHAMMDLLKSGQLVLRGEASPCAPAQLHFQSSTECLVTVHEGRYHQVRRMFAACGGHVQQLQRVSFGHIELDQLDLQRGEWRHLPLDAFENSKGIALGQTTRY